MQKKVHFFFKKNTLSLLVGGYMLMPPQQCITCPLT